jgi:hypothetical protein
MRFRRIAAVVIASRADAFLVEKVSTAYNLVTPRLRSAAGLWAWA